MMQVGVGREAYHQCLAYGQIGKVDLGVVPQNRDIEGSTMLVLVSVFTRI